MTDKADIGKGVFFVSGTDTDAGKSYATGWLAAQMEADGRRVATMKFVQTGNTGSSEDIEVHRRIMGHSLPEDMEGITAPEIFSYPASAALAARIDGRPVDFARIEKALAVLAGRYDTVLVEGAGGLLVPMDYSGTLAIDFAVSHSLPVVLVTNGRLGSINHTLLSLEAIASRGLTLKALVYNPYYDYDPTIAADTFDYVSGYTRRHFPGAAIIKIPVIR